MASEVNEEFLKLNHEHAMHARNPDLLSLLSCHLMGNRSSSAKRLEPSLQAMAAAEEGVCKVDDAICVASSSSLETSTASGAGSAASGTSSTSPSSSESLSLASCQGFQEEELPDDGGKDASREIHARIQQISAEENWPNGPSTVEELFRWQHYNASRLIGEACKATAEEKTNRLKRLSSLLSLDWEINEAYAGTGNAAVTLHQQITAFQRELRMVAKNEGWFDFCNHCLIAVLREIANTY